MMQNGYRKLKFRGKQYLVHRIAWLLQHGSWPVGDIDHIDGNPSNNKLENLRDVPHSVNLQNRKSAEAGNKFIWACMKRLSLLIKPIRKTNELDS